MFELVSFIFSAAWILILFSVISTKLGKAGKPRTGTPVPSRREDSPYTGQAQSSREESSASNMPRKISSSGKLKTAPARTAESVSGRSSLRDLTGVMLEDRKNDWLAKQLREEANIARRSELDLGAAHERECAADDLRKASRKKRQR